MNILDKLEVRNSLTPEGRAWLTKALDPFHDFEVQVSGMPDSDTSAVVIEEFKETQSFSAPPGTSGNWDAHIFNLPIAPTVNNVCTLGGEFMGGFIQSTQNPGGTQYVSAAGNQPVFVPQVGVPTTKLGLLNVHTFNSTGRRLAPTRETSAYTIPDAVSVMGASPNGRRRLIGLGYEIHDTTASLSKQGSLVAYRMPQSLATEDAVGMSGFGPLSVTPPFATTVSIGAPIGNSLLSTTLPQRSCYLEYNLPPSTPNLAMEYAGSRQWEAKDGAYVVVAQDVERNQLSFDNSRYLAFTDGDFNPDNMAGTYSSTQVAQASAWYNPNVTGSSATIVGGSTPVTTAPGYVAAVAPPSVLTLPFHTSGVMLTGLNQASTFTVTVRTLWEIAPVTGDSLGGSVVTINPLVPLARPSCEQDDMALALYQRAVMQLPVAVPVKMNAAGDFWDWCMQAVGAAAPVVGSLFAGQPGNLAGKLVSSGMSGLRARRNAADDLRNKAFSNLANRDVIRDGSVFKPGMKGLAIHDTKPKVFKGAGVPNSAFMRSELSKKGIKLKGFTDSEVADLYRTVFTR